MSKLIKNYLLGLEEYEDAELGVDENEPETVSEIEAEAVQEITETITGDNDETDPTIDPEDIPLHEQMQHGHQDNGFSTEHERDALTNATVDDLEASQAALEAYRDILVTNKDKRVSVASLAAMRQGMDYIAKRHNLKTRTLGLEEFEVTDNAEVTQVKPDVDELDPMVEELQEQIEVASMEGIGNLFGDLFRNVTKGSRPNIDKDYNTVSISDKLKKTYGDPNWLSKRRFIQEDMELTLPDNLDADFAKLINTVMTDTRRAFSTSATQYNKLVRTMAPWTNYLIKQEYKQKPNLLGEMLSTAPAFNEDTLTFKLFPVSKLNDPVKVTVRPLTADEIAKATKLIINYIDFYMSSWEEAVGKEWLTTFNFRIKGLVFSRFVPAGLGESRKFSDVISGIVKNTDGPFQQRCLQLSYKLHMFSVSAERYMFEGSYPIYSDLMETIRPIIKWITASVR